MVAPLTPPDKNVLTTETVIVEFVFALLPTVMVTLANTTTAQLVATTSNVPETVLAIALTVNANVQQASLVTIALTVLAL